MNASNVIVGIDLGTTNSLVAVCDERGPRILEGPGGEALLPSVVRYDGNAVVVGSEAKARAAEFPLSTINSVKRLMGRSARDAAPDASFVSYRVLAGERGTARVAVPGELGDRTLSPEEISSEVLRALKARAEAALGHEVTRAVVTVPAYFDDAQRQATRTAGRLAGLDVVRMVPEPTAAALAYGLGLERASDRNRAGGAVVVYDLGGGTFDVSILRLTPGAGGDDTSFFQVLATAGDTHLGGDDADHLLMAVFRREMLALLGADPSAPLPPGVRRGLVSLAEGVKRRLSEEESAGIEVDLGGQTYRRTVTRAEFEALIAPLVERTIQSCAQAMADAAPLLAGEPIAAVVLVGGSTRIPLVRRRVAEHFGMEPYTALDPDRVVALGAAVQGAILSGVQRGALLLDVIPLSLGIETVGGAVAKLIVRNSTVPARATEMFSTSVDGQTSVRFTVYQGEREMAADCRKLAEFHLKGIPPMPAGIPQLEVQFLVDANGVLNVSATERRSGKRAALQVVPNHGLTAEEVLQVERDALTHARDDMTRHRVVDLIANSALDIKWISERLERLGHLLEPDYRDSLRARLDALRGMVDRAKADWRSVDANAFHRAKEELDRASVRLQEVGIAESLRSE